MKVRALVSIAAVALMLTVLIGIATNVGVTAGQATADSITWCRSCI